MFRAHLKLVFRTMAKHRGYTMISIAGLALALTCAFLMLLFITFETSYDKYNVNAGRVYRVTSAWSGDRAGESAAVSGDLPLDGQFPEVEKTARLFTYSWREKALVAGNEKSFFEERFFLADPSIFDVLSFDFVWGDPETALAGPSDLVISESTAVKYFGRENPLGKVLAVKNLGQADMKVTGVFRDMPPNSHVHCDFIAPFSAGDTLFWSGFAARNNSYVYLLLARGASPSGLESKFPAFLAGHLGDRSRNVSLRLQPLTAIHLRSHFSDEIEPGGNLGTVRLFGLLAFIVLAVAVINFVNLTTARSVGRAREIGLKKVSGAGRGALIRQFLAEAVLFALLALPVALALAQALLPLFNGMLDASLTMNFKGNGRLFAGAALLTVLTGLLSGLFPAFVLSGFRPVEVLKGKFSLGSRGAFVRRSLVVLQYAASIVLMIGAAVVATQLHFIQSKDLGFDRDQVVILPVKDAETMAGYDALKTAFLRSPAVLGVSGSEGIPSRIRRRHAVLHEGAPGGEEVEYPVCFVDFDFLSTYKIELLSGRDFSPGFGSDDKLAYIINETAARSFGWADPVGKKIQLSNRDLMRAEFEPGEVVGVVRDFHFRSLHEKIEPLVLKIRKAQFTHVAVRLAPGQVRGGLDFLAASWKQLFPGRPFEFSFLDEDIDRLYREDRRTGRVFGYATSFSILIAGLGLFGLASFSTAQRTREIGIRKVLGASAESIVVLLSREFAALVLAANILAAPVAYLLMTRWLQAFAYRTGPGAWTFIVAAALSFLTALATVSTKAMRSALSNPVDSLRYE
ncbi:MAG: ABC transporter permease [Candidatus Aminicenantes bacterium]|nr:ABC transporter permease [Candidatus Aminicenantes bacterium]